MTPYRVIRRLIVIGCVAGVCMESLAAGPFRHRIRVSTCRPAVCTASHLRGCARTLPPIFETDAHGEPRSVADDKLMAFEKELRQEVVGDNAPDEVFALANSGTADFYMYWKGQTPAPRELLVIAIYGTRGELRRRWDFDEQKSVRELSAAELAAVRAFGATSKHEELPMLGSGRAIKGKKGEMQIVGGTTYGYLRLNRSSGRRVLINNPPYKGEEDTYPPDDPLWRYTKVIDFFRRFEPAAAAPETFQEK